MTPVFGFVVLNYVTHDETVGCVESILRLPGDGYRIVVVDNASPNDSLDILRRRFAGDDRIAVIDSGRNGGYSFGNNVGIAHLRGRGIVDVIIATSDTRVEDDQLLEKCAEAKALGAAVVGPYVRGMRDEPQNPLETSLSLRYIAALHGGRPWEALRHMLARSPFKRLLRGDSPPRQGEPSPAGAIDVYMVHGAFLYLSEHFFKRMTHLDEDLFMYGEEDLLAWNCRCAGLRTVYDPRMRVHHRDSRTAKLVGNDVQTHGMAASFKTLRSKIRLTRLLHAYLFAHRQ